MQGVALQASLQANNLFLQGIDLIKRDYILASEYFDRLTIF
jgi:ribulose 1,5-bisphosphate carboxylase large subunit-like protein